MESVVSSEMTGSSHPFTGQERSNFANPFRERPVTFRANRYSPGPNRSISKTCPALIPSSRRISTGNTI